jgi:hypothetical protein
LTDSLQTLRLEAEHTILKYICFQKKKNFVAALMVVFDTLVVRGNRALGRNPVRAQTLPEGTHLVPSLTFSLTRKSLFELRSVDMLLITKEIKHREIDF